MSHTPGPWKTRQKESHGTSVEGPCTIAWCGTNSELNIKEGTYYGIKEDEAYANALLIAAAPDILEALEAALDAECGKKCRCEQGWHAVAKAAVAKARRTP